MEVTRPLARYVIDSRYADIPQKVRSSPGPDAPVKTHSPFPWR